MEAFRLRAREDIMKAIHWTIAAAALALVQPTAASAAQSDPEVIIYRFPGVRDFNGNPTPATVFNCTNFSGATETIRFVTRHHDGGLESNKTVPIAHLATVTASTTNTAAYIADVTLAASFFAIQGTTAIAATSINIVCTAVTLDASSIAPNGFALRGIRFNPAPGSQE